MERNLGIVTYVSDSLTLVYPVSWSLCGCRLMQGKPWVSCHNGIQEIQTFYRRRWNSDLFFVHQPPACSFVCYHWQTLVYKKKVLWIKTNVRLLKWLRGNSRPWTTCCVVHQCWVTQSVPVCIANPACDHKSILIWKSSHSKPHVDCRSSITHSCYSLPGCRIFDSSHRSWDIEWIKVGIWLVLEKAGSCARAAIAINLFWYEGAAWMMLFWRLVLFFDHTFKSQDNNLPHID